MTRSLRAPKAASYGLSALLITTVLSSTSALAQSHGDHGAHHGTHAHAAEPSDRWTVSTHTELFLVHNQQSGPRGDDKTYVAGMVMAEGKRQFSGGHSLTLQTMLSPDPWMGKSGYPLLLQAGESADGRTPLVDRQHPHDLVMALSATYRHRLSDTESLSVLVGWPAAPAFGPDAFMHRASAGGSPEAPITHHWFDSTHITYGVVTVGWQNGPLTLEGSAFKGREPDETRFDLDNPKLDSQSARLTWQASPHLALQISGARQQSPEALDPHSDQDKLSASASYMRPLSGAGQLAITGAWASKKATGRRAQNAWLFEASYRPAQTGWQVFTRAEQIDTDELGHSHGHGHSASGKGHHGPVETVRKLSLGAAYDFALSERIKLGLGALYSRNQVPDALHDYGRNPHGTQVFLRLVRH